jgi:hypothetical protein
MSLKCADDADQIFLQRTQRVQRFKPVAPPVVATMTSGNPPATSSTYSVVTPPTVCVVRLPEPSYSKLLATPSTFALTRRLAASQVYTLVPWVSKLPRSPSDRACCLFVRGILYCAQQ